MLVLMFGPEGNLVRPYLDPDAPVKYFAVFVKREVHVYKVVENAFVRCPLSDWPKKAVDALMKEWKITGIKGDI